MQSAFTPPDDLFLDLATTYKTFRMLSLGMRGELLCPKVPQAMNSEEEKQLIEAWTKLMGISWEAPWLDTSLRFLGRYVLRFDIIGEFSS